MVSACAQRITFVPHDAFGTNHETLITAPTCTSCTSCEADSSGRWNTRPWPLVGAEDAKGSWVFFLLLESSPVMKLINSLGYSCHATPVSPCRLKRSMPNGASHLAVQVIAALSKFQKLPLPTLNITHNHIPTLKDAVATKENTDRLRQCHSLVNSCLRSANQWRGVRERSRVSVELRHQVLHTRLLPHPFGKSETLCDEVLIVH